MADDKILIVHPECMELVELGARLEESGHGVIERTVGIGAAAAVVRERPAVTIVHAGMPLVPGRDVVVAVKRSWAGRGAKVLLYGPEGGEELEAQAESCGADGHVSGGGDALFAAVRRFLPRASKSESAPPKRRTPSGTRLKKMGGYVLIACDPRTRERLGDLERSLTCHVTDSGTEALRLICSPDPPRAALIGTSLADLRCDIIMKTAIRVDERWRSKLVVLEENELEAHEPGAIELEGGLGTLRWSDREPTQGLFAILERLREAS
ncbi:MAG: hypothetical protein RLO52_15050 [Sandaracinaceae bacterium]